jgi:hypothetical protein
MTVPFLQVFPIGLNFHRIAHFYSVQQTMVSFVNWFAHYLALFAPNAARPMSTAASRRLLQLDY